jgi:transposase
VNEPSDRNRQRAAPGRVGHPAKIRAAETRKQKHDRRDARLILDLVMRKDGFHESWMPSIEQRDLRTLLRDRQQWVKIRTRVQNTLQAITLNHALRQNRGLWIATGQKALQAFVDVACSLLLLSHRKCGMLPVGNQHLSRWDTRSTFSKVLWRS